MRVQGSRLTPQLCVCMCVCILASAFCTQGRIAKALEAAMHSVVETDSYGNDGSHTPS